MLFMSIWIHKYLHRTIKPPNLVGCIGYNDIVETSLNMNELVILVSGILWVLTFYWRGLESSVATLLLPS